MFAKDEANKMDGRHIRSTFSTIVFFYKSLSRRLNSEDKEIRILNYHRISEEGYEKSATGVSPSNFEAQMHFLSTNGYRAISLFDLLQYLNKGLKLPEKAVSITFDDGYMDNYSHAFPILKKYNFTASIFLITSSIGKTYEDEKMLTWDQIKEMNEYGIDFGSHGITHPRLTKLPINEAVKEVRESKRFLEESLGKEILLFCYPHGDFNADMKTIVKESGYTCACSTIPGGNMAACDLFALKRTWISPKDTLFDLEKKLCGAYDLLYRLLKIARLTKAYVQHNR